MQKIWIWIIAVALVCTAAPVAAQEAGARDDYDGSPGVIVVDPPPKAVGPVQFGSVLWDNGPLVNGSGTGVGGADESILQNVSLGMNTLGFGHQVAFDNRVADDFTVADPLGWDITTITFYAYQTNSTTTSTITAVNLRIWDGVPGGGGTVIFGDTSTNLMTGTTWSSIYRVTESTTGSATNRPIMVNTVDVTGLHLDPGTYWLDWQTDGTLGSGPWAPPVTINGTASTGDGLQSLDNGLTFGPANDSGPGTPQQAFPFVIEGTAIPVELQSFDIE